MRSKQINLIALKSLILMTCSDFFMSSCCSALVPAHYQTITVRAYGKSMVTKTARGIEVGTIANARTTARAKRANVKEAVIKIAIAAVAVIPTVAVAVKAAKTVLLKLSSNFSNYP